VKVPVGNEWQRKVTAQPLSPRDARHKTVDCASSAFVPARVFFVFHLLYPTAFIRARPLFFRAPSAGAGAIIHFQTIKK
jgi:hypothetical protein